MSRFAGIAFMLLLSAPELALAQTSCTTITDASKRLACYDALNSVSSPQAGTVLDFDDFVTDVASLRGKQAKISLYVGQIANQTVGYRKDVFGPFIMLDTSELSRDDRKKINRDCVASTGLCRATVTGKATHDYGMAGIKVTGINWN